jgi:acyl-CoA reductase-like NAD-dependent aldehyde dehydrogenase
VTEALISYQVIRKIKFISNIVVSKIISQVTSKYLKPILIEFRGKVLVIILKDIDLQKAA